MPSPEELGDNPCGNPNWAKLPPGVGETDADEQEEPPSEDSVPEDPAAEDLIEAPEDE